MAPVAQQVKAAPVQQQNYSAPQYSSASTNPKQNPGPYPEVAIQCGVVGKVPNLVCNGAPPGKNRPPNPIFLTYKEKNNNFLIAAQMQAYIDPDLEYVENQNMPTSSGDPTNYTGYKNATDEKHGVGKITYMSGDEF